MLFLCRSPKVKMLRICQLLPANILGKRNLCIVSNRVRLKNQPISLIFLTCRNDHVILNSHVHTTCLNSVLNPRLYINNNEYVRKISSTIRRTSSESLELGNSALSNEFSEDWCACYDPSTLAENIYDTSTKYVEEKPLEFAEEPAVKVKATKNGATSKKKKKAADENCEELKKEEKNDYFLRSLRTYIYVCANANMNNRAHECVMYYRYKNSVSKQKTGNINIGVYNALLNCWASTGNMEKLTQVLACMSEDGIIPNLQSHIAHLECLAKCRDCSDSSLKRQLETIEKALKDMGKTFTNLFEEGIFRRDQAEKIEKLVGPHYNVRATASPQDFHVPYTCKLLEELNDKEYERSSISPFISNSISKADIADLTEKQMQLETDYLIKVKSVNMPKEITNKMSYMRKCVEDSEEFFKKQLSEALDQKIENLFSEIDGKNNMSLYPYLHVIEREVLVNTMLQEIRWIAESAEFFSPCMSILCKDMGRKVMNHYFIVMRKQNKIFDKLTFIHQKYLEYVLTSDLITRYSPREYWEYLKSVHFKGPTIDVSDIPWPQHVQMEVGKFLYDILLHNLLFDVNSVQFNEKKRKKRNPVMVPPFYTIYEKNRKEENEKYTFKTSLQVRAHPKITMMYSIAELSDIEFDVSMIPMLCPPRPWTRLDAGGMLMTSTPFVRFPSHAPQLFSFYDNVPNKELNPCFDSLNSLSLCPWIINKPVLDLIIKVFQDNGCEELDVPLNPTVSFDLPVVKSSMSDDEKRLVRKERAIMKKKKQETTSLWFGCLYKLSIANEFRDKVFWFPHNLDFRGRVYPTPPHFNHLGSDLVRSILLFAEGKPLGKEGFDWLKIHLINLTGFKKREPNSERLRFANEIIPEILDSADNPFTGNQWWRTSDEPWQTLACCMEIARALRSPDPAKFVSHLPIHQDGSCNGLQHYAALGRDEFGAKEVNLFPADRPQDVYSGVATLVEEERKKDAAEEHKVATALKGFVKRKVVKQTVMTFVYGVTEYGAKLQILKQLKDIPEFSDQHCNPAAHYLTKMTFSSIQKMFTATREIQKWFTDCAELITRVTGQPVEWVTPLGLPVIQPYHKKVLVRSPSDFTKGDVLIYSSSSDSASYTSTYEKYRPPNTRKQKNAFAPNFIHSLDSSHMMLTSLFCQRKGVTFVSVHDCYWTHPESVKIMNEICRQQFVSLHSEPILENLSEFFIKRFGDYKLSDEQDNTKKFEKLKSVISKVPEKGNFNLNYVLDSVYFFS